MKKAYIRPNALVEVVDMEQQLMSATSTIGMDDTPATGDALDRDDEIELMFGNDNNIFMELMK